MAGLSFDLQRGVGLSSNDGRSSIGRSGRLFVRRLVGVYIIIGFWVFVQLVVSEPDNLSASLKPEVLDSLDNFPRLVIPHQLSY